ncbi:PDZ domain-containing protein GIPC2-like [Otolemur garnettii]|uniref:PDZ domain-containing protein GIPC2-like n=1 Tax=Otolemur garnettii TaxID=30611 RepID=UPI000273F938|nr:PDZ domain-containing protein GIPC2-like [Otolemur garnettii]
MLRWLWEWLFKPAETKPTETSLHAERRQKGAASGSAPVPPDPATSLVFWTLLAHGSPAYQVEGFSSIQELYAKIADMFGISPSEILYCTSNTPKVDMERLTGGQIGLNDFIFAHVRGRKKEVRLCKSEDSPDLILSDNGAGCVFIKRIRDGGIIHLVQTICVGDHIESINGESVVGWCHYAVAQKFKELKKWEHFTMTLIEPKKAPEIQPRSKAGKSLAEQLPEGENLPRKSLRLRSKGTAIIEEMPSGAEAKAIERIDDLLELYMGIQDADLATEIFEAGKDKDTSEELVKALKEVLEDFIFPEEVVPDVWKAIRDARRINGPL